MSDSEKERWDHKYRGGAGATEPSAYLLSLDALLPKRGRALDLAGGRGRHAIWLAARGLDVTLADISEVGLSQARAAAQDAGVSIVTVAIDLERSPPPGGPWDLIVCVHYLHKPLFGFFTDLLAPGGLLVFCQPTLRNLERHARPGRPYLLVEGELPTLVQGLEVLQYEEGWLEEGRHEARLVARSP
jgi:2-polyprenyl-3-methyl-5-hydroxy-6-metoxy-1,4-benzoquinol methylase